MKRMVCNNSKWKAANQSKDWRIRRWLFCNATEGLTESDESQS
jgi:hypothetical protein